MSKTHLAGIGSLKAIKARAVEVRAEIRAMGCNIKHGQALDAASREYGLADWNAACARGSRIHRASSPLVVQLPYTTVRPLPALPPRPSGSDASWYQSIGELMDVASFYIQLSALVPQRHLHYVFEQREFEVPYAFVPCDSLYGEESAKGWFCLVDSCWAWEGTEVRIEQLEELGVPRWSQRHGGPSEDSCYSVFPVNRKSKMIDSAMLNDAGHLLEAVALAIFKSADMD